MIIRATLIGLAASGLLCSAAQAQQAFSPVTDVYASPLFDFEGFYAGASGGGYLGDDGGVAIGVVAGVNFAINDFLYAGLEFEGGPIFGETWTYDAFALLHAGALVSDQMLTYVALGAGTAGGEGSYALGGGVEFGLMPPLSVRGEVLGVGTWGSGFDSAKGTASIIWHFN